MHISRFPHNLFLNENDYFMYLDQPVTNILSTEWFLKRNFQYRLNKNYSKSIWIPTEGGDWELNHLYGTIENTLAIHSFTVLQQVELDAPIASDLNIVCSHGAKDIANIQILYQAGVPTFNLNRIIGSGKILIFFVCYSGSMQNDFFRNSVISIVKSYISQGYEAVIAPFWALQVNIPKFWLPAFLEAMDDGATVSEAVYKANKKVYEVFPTPAAWACLHLYGNPHLKVG